jgi:hypothetical protein
MEQLRQRALGVPEVSGAPVGNERQRLLVRRVRIVREDRYPSDEDADGTVPDRIEDGGLDDRGPLPARRSGRRKEEQEAGLVGVLVEGCPERLGVD